MKKILGIIIFTMLIFTNNVKAENKTCEYKDDNVNVTVYIENNQIKKYEYYEYNKEQQIYNVQELANKSVINVDDFVPNCTSKMYYRKTDECIGGAFGECTKYNRTYIFYSEYNNESDLNTLALESSTVNDSPSPNDKVQVNNNFFGNLDVVQCGNAEVPSSIPPIIRTVVTFIKIATPLVLIIVGMIDFMKAVTANDEKKLKDAQMRFVKRLIPAALVFLVVTIVQFIIGIIASEDVSLINCVSCMMVDPENCIVINKPIDNPNDNSDGSKRGSYITDISNDGVIVTVEAEDVSGISGYYFSYDDELPEDENSGYVETSDESIEVIRLPGETYVWVVDDYGRVSEPETIMLTNDILVLTKNKKNKTLKNQTLPDYLEKQGTSLEQFNNLIARSVRAAGLYTKDAAAAVALSLTAVLPQKYNIKIEYHWGGKSWNIGATGSKGHWGTYKTDSSGELTVYGLDCTGFATWAYVNAGADVRKDPSGFPSHYPKFGSSKYVDQVEFTPDNGEPGDFLNMPGHVAMIIGVTNDGYIVAEALTPGYGVILNLYKHNKKYVKGGKLTISKGERMFETYEKISPDKLPTGY